MKVNCFKGNIRVACVDLIDTTTQSIKDFMNLNHLDYITGKYYPIAIKTVETYSYAKNF